MSINTAEDFILTVHYRLLEFYRNQIRYDHNYDPVSELVSSLLSHRTTNQNEKLAFDNLLTRFGSWENVMRASLEAIIQEIKPTTWPEQKAPRLKRALQMIVDKTGKLSLDFLSGLDAMKARKWLEALPGVGPKSSAAILSYSTLKARALPVDSHHFRVAVRLGIIDKKLGEIKANLVLENLLPKSFTAMDVFENHQVMMLHGQQICFYHNPKCGECILLDICPTGQLLF